MAATSPAHTATSSTTTRESPVQQHSHQHSQHSQHSQPQQQHQQHPPLPLPPPPTLQHQQHQHQPQQRQASVTFGPSDERLAKRQKVTRACDDCKSRKRKCTGELPCQACHSNGSRCTYLASYTRGRPVQPQTRSTGSTSSSSNNRLPPAGPQAGVAFTSPTHHQPTHFEPVVRAPQTYQQPEPSVKASRTSSPEGAGGVGGDGGGGGGGGGNVFAGQDLGPSPWSFLRRAWKRFEEDGTKVNCIHPEEPSPVGSIFTHGDRQPPPVDRSAFRLPPRDITSTLVQHYFNLAMPTYRFLHQGTVLVWLESFHEAEEQGRHPARRFPAREAVVLVVLATARLLNVDDREEILDPDERIRADSERLYQMAQARLQRETGRATLESVQARIASCLFLLQSSRPNEAWYLFGTTVQLLFNIGLHRSENWTKDAVARECRKRAFWACSTLDTYLSVIKGVPPLINLDDVDQRLPDAIDDEDLTALGSMATQTRGDSVIKASILHAQVTRIVKTAAREQYLSENNKKKSFQKLGMAAKLNAETDAWHASLPVVLSGAIHPSSLIPIFRRQITVLQLAHAHAQMLINRPSLLVDSSHSGLREAQVQTCLSAAKSTLDTILATSFNKHIFQAFWYTQFVSFNALSIVYIWLIQRKNGHLPPLSPAPSQLASTITSSPLHEDDLLQLAQTVQQHLVDATEANAPSLRYNIVLEELQQEVHRMMTTTMTTTTNPPPHHQQQHQQQQQRPPHLSALLETGTPSNGRASENHNSSSSPSSSTHYSNSASNASQYHHLNLPLPTQPSPSSSGMTTPMNRVVTSVETGPLSSNSPFGASMMGGGAAGGIYSNSGGGGGSGGGGDDFPLDPDLWLTLDSFPFSDFGQLTWR